jgi:ketosteroid isomerase-like protein
MEQQNAWKGRYMPAADATMEVVRRYHDAWTNRNFAEAVRLLAPHLEVEVPINEYPTKESFAKALSAFGALVKDVVLLAEFAKEAEAMLLYDMDVDHLGTLRVAEHFTVADGKIVRIRQIHDTAVLRRAGFAQST